MKVFIVLLLGLVLGAAAALGILYINPMTGEMTPVVNSNTVLRYQFPSSDALVVTHGADIGIDRQPPGVKDLWESGIVYSMLNVLVLRDAQDTPVAIASRMSSLSRDTNLLTSGVIQNDNWLITYPGQGSMQLESQSNIWPLVRSTIVDVKLLRQPWEGAREYRPTIGPDIDGSAALTGATGSLRSSYGSGTESFIVEKYSRENGLEGPIVGELRLRIVADETRAAGL